MDDRRQSTNVFTLEVKSRRQSRVPGSLEQVAVVEQSEQGGGAVCEATTRERESERAAECVRTRLGDNSTKNKMVSRKTCQLSG
jgi:hypothetical protein